jgi:hypothetical protein
MSRVDVIHHVQITCPPGSEDVLRAFYVGVLGLIEVPKPPALAPRGGCCARSGRALAARLTDAGGRLTARFPACGASTPRIPTATASSSSPPFKSSAAQDQGQFW